MLSGEREREGGLLVMIGKFAIIITIIITVAV